MKSYIFLFFFVAVLLFSCNTDKNGKNHINNKDTSSLDTTLANIDEYAKLLSGTNSSFFEDIQKKDFYRTFQRSISTTWNYFYTNQLTIITNWSLSNKITSKTDTLPVFYPFSGPDFPFVYAFFPYSSSYIFVGLENIGKIPQFETYSDLEIDRYINSLSSSMTDYFLYGFFSTQNLKNSFRSTDMNGVVHPLVFFINRTNHQIDLMRYFVIDKFGKIQYVNDFEPVSKLVKGVEFDFSGSNGNKKLYYLQFDLSNQNFSDYPEFYAFISSFGQKNVFIKSASYLLQDSKFSSFRDQIISQCSKILQDDSGISFEVLNNNDFSVSLFGNYVHTLNIFSKYYQKDLKKAFDDQNPVKLPFRFGYNIPFDQTTLIFAVKKIIAPAKYPFYAVQFKMSWNKLSADSFPKILLNNLDYYFDEGYYKYFSGNYSSLDQAQNQLNVIKSMGYNDAFILQFFKDKKIIIQQQ